jgi:hypothetical protein
MLRDFINIVPGINELQRGGSPRGLRTATAANIIQQNSQLRQGEMADIVQDFVRNVLRKDLKLMQQTYDIERVIAIVGDDPRAPEFLKFDRNAIIGEYEVELEPFSALQKNEELEKQQELQFTNLAMGAFPDIVDRVELFKDMAKKFGKRNINKLIPALGQKEQAEPPKDPSVENLIMASGGEASVSVNDNHAAHVQSHQSALEQLTLSQADEVTSFRFSQHIQQHQLIMEESQSQSAQTGRIGQNLGLIPGIGLGNTQSVGPVNGGVFRTGGFGGEDISEGGV